MKRLRVLVVDDSITVRKRLCEVLSTNSEFEVVAEASDGREAIARCLSHQPDVITMDMALPVMSGLAATEYIMAHRPTPILIVSSSFNRGDVFKTYDALAAGAVDVFEKPSHTDASDEWERAFVSALRIAARVRVITHPRARLAGSIAPPSVATTDQGFAPQILALGASTGGPGAIVSVLRAVSAEVQQPVVLVIHIGATFALSFAEWLDSQIARPVRIARDGESLASIHGQVRLAPADHHLEVHGTALRLSQAPERHSCRPSVDVLFESLARSHPSSTVACLLTGMGRDGAAGLLALRQAGAITIAQDEQSSVVYGMPREAALLGAAARILPLTAIGPTVSSLCLRREAT